MHALTLYPHQLMSEDEKRPPVININYVETEGLIIVI